MKKTGLILSLVVGMAGAAVAQKDKRAAAVLDAMSARYKSLSAYAAAFTYAAGSESMKGDLTVKGQKFRLKLAGQEVFNDGKSVSTYVKETNEVNVQDLETAAGDINPARIYTIYKTGYNYKYVGEQKQGGQPVEVIELTPEKKNTQVARVQISVNKADKSVKSWKITDKAGKVTSYTITRFTPNPKVTDAFFSFDKARYPGVEVVDLR